MVRRTTVMVALLAACDGGSSGPADVTPAVTAVPDTAVSQPAESAEPTFEARLAEIDPASGGALSKAVEAFVAAHAPDAPADELAASIERLVAFVQAGAEALDETVQADPALLSAACAEVGVECGGPPSEQAAADLAALSDRGVRVLYTGEGTVTMAPDLAQIASALGDAVPEGARARLVARGATALAESRYDEGGFGGDPDLMAAALLRWEALAATEAQVWAQGAADEVDRLRVAYLRLCDHGEWETPSCNAREPLRRSYATFVEAHADSPSAPAVAALRAALKKNRWTMKSEQLDAAVSEALTAVPADR